MDVAAIRTIVKEIIGKATSIKPEEIDDMASFADDLMLDSLSLLEIGVDVDHVFKLNIPDEELAERLKDLRTVQDSVEFVQAYMVQNEKGVPG